MFKPRSLLSRRPSASMVMSTLALFVALSGGAYAAVVVPRSSVGTAQLKNKAVTFAKLANSAVGTRDVANNAITYTKIAKGEIGHARVAQNQIQWRVTGKCAGDYAIQSVSDTGGVTCASTLPTDYTTAGLSDPLTSTSSATVLASETLPAGTAYDLTSTPYVEVAGTGGSQNVTVTCEIAAGNATETRSATFALTAAHEQATAQIPLEVTLAAPASATSAAVACVRSYDGTVAPAVQGSAGLNALASNVVTQTTPGTSSTALTLSVPTPTTTTGTTTTGTTTTTTTTGTTTTG